ncbi:hypothetical protein DYY88_21575 [Leptolyngbya iicbica LK]|uniref:Uncharacterized protein n=2 Tax=Cyanophyceae TaxID=3028117 RepID=A0A4Q7E257_9CYAN|nr:hypothetical protein DYY88_21575 [Leptolyngbya sp. LK]
MPITERWQLVQMLLSSIQQETQTATNEADESTQSPTEIGIAIAHLHPWTQSFVGLLPATSEDLQATYVDYLEEKYA